MIILLYGEDDFRSLQKLKEIIARYQSVHKTGLNLKYLDFQKDSFEDFRDQLRTESMFREKKLFVLKNAFSNTQFKERFEKQKKEFLKSQHIILFHEKRNLEKDSFFILLEKDSKFQKFDPLGYKELESWINKESKKMGFEIQKEAKDFLIEYIGNNLWQLSNELKKLVSYKWDPKGTIITKKDIEMLTSQKIELNIFKTIDFIARKQKQKALFLLKRHLEEGGSPLYLLTMINFQFRNLLMLKGIEESGKNIRTETRKLGMHPFVVKKSLGLCKEFTLEELKKIYQKIFQTDLDVKTGKTDPELALDLLIARI